MSKDDKAIRVTKENTTTTYRESTVVKKDGSVTHIMTSENESLKTKALRAEYAITDLVDSAMEKAVASVKAKADDLFKSGALEPGYAAAKKDSADISKLSPMLTDLIGTFERTMINIEDYHSYDEQVQILSGYKKLLEEQVNVIDSRLHFVKRVH